MGKIQRIGFDLDDVLLDTSPYLEEYLKANFSFEFSEEQKRSCARWDEIPGLPPLIVEEIKKAFTNPEFLLRIPPILGAKEALAFLKRKGFSTHIITARPPDIFVYTNHHLKNNEIHFDSLTCCGKRRFKPRMAFGLKLDAYIDDDLETLEMFSGFRHRSKEWRLALFDRVWNEGIYRKWLTRVRPWEDIYDFVGAKRRRNYAE